MKTITIIYPNPIKENHYFIMDNIKEFISKENKVAISREGYYSYPCPLDADKVSDETMQAIAEQLDYVLYKEYNFNKEDIDLYINNPEVLAERDFNLLESIDEVYWKELEEIAVAHNMPYCNDEE